MYNGLSQILSTSSSTVFIIDVNLSYRMISKVCYDTGVMTAENSSLPSQK